VVALGLSVAPLSWAQDAKTDEIELCDFQVLAELARANASFSVIFQIQTDGGGRPSKVAKLKNDFLQDEPFMACLRRWILPAPNAQVIVVLNWKHGRGWTQLNIDGQGIHRKIRLQPGLCGAAGR